MQNATTNDTSKRSNSKLKDPQTVNAKVAGKVYGPLKEDQIRLVRLHAGARCVGGAEPSPAGQGAGDIDSDFLIHCSLFTADLGEQLEYEALSYVWGSYTDLQAIQLDEEHFRVTRNLFAALDALRLPDRDRILWVDALAINQSDFFERASQVKHMTQIYKLAKATLIWLSDGGVHAHQIEEHPLWTHICGRWSEDTSTALCTPGEETWTSEVILALWLGLAKLQYWHRVWTAQEVLYSRRATLVTAAGSVPFEVLDHLTTGRALGDFLPGVAEHSKFVQFYDTCLFLQPGDISQGNWFNFDKWVRSAVLRSCFDPKDYVFGFHGCFPSAVRKQITVDYTLAVDEVFKEATMAFLHEEGRLDYLQYSNSFDQGPRRTDGRPSWMVGFESKKGTPRHEHNQWPEPSRKRSPPQDRVFMELLEGSSVLHVRGRWVGEVKHACPAWGATTSHLHGTSEESRVLRVLMHLKLWVSTLHLKEDEVFDFSRALECVERGRFDEERHAVREILALLLTAARDDSLLQHLRQFTSKSLEILEAVFLTTTTLRLRDKRTGRSGFGVTWDAGDNVRRGDRVCLLEGCLSVLILRAEVTSRFRFRQPKNYTIVGCSVLEGGYIGEYCWLQDVISEKDLQDIFLR